MHHLVFIPGKPDTVQALEAVGLNNHKDKAQFTFWDAGPEGRQGCCVSYPGADPIYNPAEQVWVPSVNSNNHPAGSYFIGYNPKRLPDPRDLLRKRPLHGQAVQLGDGQYWTLPPLSALPSKYVLLNNGDYASEIVENYQFFYIETMRLISKITDDQTTFDMRDLIRVVDIALSFNYRVTPELTANVLKLHTTETVTAAFMAITGLKKGE